MSNSTEPVPSIETIIEDFVQDYDADVAAIHQRCLVGAITIEQQTAESEERWKHHMKRAKARHERICASERQAGEKNGAAFAVMLVDDVHMSDPDFANDRLYNGVKNRIRDGFKAVTGTDPAPSYPVKVRLQTQLEGETK